MSAILDDDLALPEVSLMPGTSPSTPEGNAPSAGALLFTVQRHGDLGAVSTVLFTLGSGPGPSVGDARPIRSDEWAVRTPTGFTWWADQNAQTIEILGEEVGPEGEDDREADQVDVERQEDDAEGQRLGPGGGRCGGRGGGG